MAAGLAILHAKRVRPEMTMVSDMAVASKLRGGILVVGRRADI